MNNTTVVGVDMGGTNIHAGRIYGDRVVQQVMVPVSAKADEDTVLHEVIEAIESVFHPNCIGVGIGVP